jgi:heat shock protein HspQ
MSSPPIRKTQFKFRYTEEQNGRISYEFPARHAQQRIGQILSERCNPFDTVTIDCDTTFSLQKTEYISRTMDLYNQTIAAFRNQVSKDNENGWMSSVIRVLITPSIDKTAYDVPLLQASRTYQFRGLSQSDIELSRIVLSHHPTTFFSLMVNGLIGNGTICHAKRTFQSLINKYLAQQGEQEEEDIDRVLSNVNVTISLHPEEQGEQEHAPQKEKSKRFQPPSPILQPTQKIETSATGVRGALGSGGGTDLPPLATQDPALSEIAPTKSLGADFFNY